MTSWYDADDLVPAQKAPAMPLAGRALASKERGPGDALEIAAARSRAAEAREARAEAAEARDPDEVAAAMIGRGVLPGQITELAQRLGDVQAELETELEKIERSQRRQEQIRRAHQNGQISAFDIARMDFDEGDVGKAERLQRRLSRLQDQLKEAAAAMAPPQSRQVDGVEAASRRAHDTFVEVTRAKMAEAQAARTVARPFGGSISRADVPDGQEVVCPDCLEMDVSWEDSTLIHHQAQLDGVDLPQRSDGGRGPMIFR